MGGEAGEREIRPSPQTRILLSMLGILLIFVGVFITLVGLFAGHGEVKAGGLVLIGPLPLFFQSDGSTGLLLLFLLLPLLIFILTLILMVRALPLGEQ